MICIPFDVRYARHGSRMLCYCRLAASGRPEDDYYVFSLSERMPLKLWLERRLLAFQGAFLCRNAGRSSRYRR